MANKKRESVLVEALRISSGDRRKHYGHPTPNHQRIAALWNGYWEARSILKSGKRRKRTLKIKPVDVVEMMLLLKAAREMNRSQRDNWTDRAGYARVGAIITGHE